MKPDDRTRALNAAAVHLGWLTAEPWCRAATALDVLADVDRRVVIAAGSRDGTGRRSIGGHSDPTATAAGARVDAGASGRRLTTAIRTDTRDITETAAWLRSTLSGGTAVPRPPADLVAALLDVEWCLTIPHAIGAWSSDDAELTSEVDHAVDHLAHACAVLQTRVGRVLRAAARPADDKPPKQLPLAGCESCARDGGYFEPVAEGRYAKLCRTCGDYKGAQGRTLPVGAVRYMHAHGKLTQKAIDDALRAEKVKPKRRIST